MLLPVGLCTLLGHSNELSRPTDARVLKLSVPEINFSLLFDLHVLEFNNVFQGEPGTPGAPGDAGLQGLPVSVWYFTSER